MTHCRSPPQATACRANKEVIHAWSEGAVARFAQALRACVARFVLTSSLRARFGRDVTTTLFSYHGIADLFCDITATPEPLFSRLVMRRSDEGPVPSDYLPRYRRMMREIWLRLDEEADGGVCHRIVEIREYLDRHPEVTSYVAIDVQDLTCGLDGHFVKTSRLIEPDSLEQILDVLSRRDEPYPLPSGCLTADVARMRRETLPLEEEEWFSFEPSRPVIRNRFGET